MFISIVKFHHIVFRKSAALFDYLGRLSGFNRVDESQRQTNKAKAEVIFVGAGAGDPELLTLKAVKALKSADVVMVDWLVNPEIRELISSDAEQIFVGKKCGRHSMKQQDINELLLLKAQQKKRVVRLKGGDPSIFARLPEETQILTNNDVPFEIVPGITAASGCAASTGIPLTHRDCAQSVKFVTAHTQSDTECDWAYLAQDQGTLVFYMGLNRVKKIAGKLVQHGMIDAMPIAVIDQGTSENQTLLTGTLNCFIENKLNVETLAGPALIVVGDVVEKRVEVVRELVNNVVESISVKGV